ncbi:MAG: phosphatidate cytidylyltransferase [Candidatus Omnitrophica bacterium]|nr:phosphatidate cytidylyltransferase [Candidatus Omnitrophota bacterium]
MNPVLKRILVSIIPVSLAVYTLLFAPLWFFLIVVEALVLLALNEYVDMVEIKGVPVSRFAILFFGALLPVSVVWSSGFLVIAMTCLSLFILDFKKRMHQHALVSTAVSIFGIIYISWFFSCLVKIRMFDHGVSWAFFTVFLVKMGDAGAYFVGIRYGKQKLIETVSPNKSVEGALGGLAMTMVLAFISKIYLWHVPVYHLLILGFFTGILAQLGDLVESLIKRDVGVKDSGHVPGLGGVLDVLDSLLLTTPFVFYYVSTFLGENPL